MTRYASLADFVTVSTDAYEVGREVLLEDADRPPDPGRDVGVDQGTLLQAIVAVGSGDARLFAPLVPAAERQVAEIDRTSPAKVQPNLSVLNVLSELQLMGVAVPEETVRTATGWLAGMRTAGMEPRWMHWNRGLAALAMGDLPTARTIAALPADGSGEADPDVSPGYSIQAWFAALRCRGRAPAALVSDAATLGGVPDRAARLHRGRRAVGRGPRVGRPDRRAPGRRGAARRGRRLDPRRGAPRR